MPGLIAMAIVMSIAVHAFVRPEAQPVGYLLVGVAVVLGMALKRRTGTVW